MEVHCNYLFGPSAYRLVPTLGQLWVEEGVEGIHTGVIVILLTSLHYQIHIKVDNLKQWQPHQNLQHMEKVIMSVL